MEFVAVKQDGYPTLSWLHPDRDKSEWGDSLHITYRETLLFPSFHELYCHWLMVCHQHDLQKLLTQDDVNEKTILLRSEEYQDNFKEYGFQHKVCMDIELCEALRVVYHQMFHSKQWLLGCPFADFSSSSSS